MSSPIDLGDDIGGEPLDAKRAVTQWRRAMALELEHRHTAAVAETCGERRELTGVAERAVEENEIGHGKTLGVGAMGGRRDARRPRNANASRGPLSP